MAGALPTKHRGMGGSCTASVPAHLVALPLTCIIIIGHKSMVCSVSRAHFWPLRCARKWSTRTARQSRQSSQLLKCFGTKCASHQARLLPALDCSPYAYTAPNNRGANKQKRGNAVAGPPAAEQCFPGLAACAAGRAAERRVPYCRGASAHTVAGCPGIPRCAVDRVGGRPA